MYERDDFSELTMLTECDIIISKLLTYQNGGMDIMKHIIKDLIEPDNGCEGFAEGEEPMVTLILDNGRSVKVPDMTAYRRGWDTGAEISDEDIAEFAK